MVINVVGAIGGLISILGVAVLILPSLGNAEVLWPHWHEPGYQRFHLRAGMKTLAVGLALCLLWAIITERIGPYAAALGAILILVSIVWAAKMGDRLGPPLSDENSPYDSAGYKSSPIRYKLDPSGLRVFEQGVLAYKVALQQLPERNRITPSDLERIRRNSFLIDAERLFKEAIEIETRNAGELGTWEQITYATNAITAHLWLSLLYVYRHEPEACERHANIADSEYQRLPREMQDRDEGLGMKADILFRRVEADAMRGIGTREQLIARYQEVLDIDHRLGDHEQETAVRQRMAEIANEQNPTS